MAGTDARFNATKFRSAVHFAMAMGQPSATQDQLVFKWTNRKTFNPGDRSAEPFNWNETPVTTFTHGPVTVPCAFEFKFSPRGQVTDTPAGQFDTPTLVVTILDTDYPLIFDNAGVRADTIDLPDKGSYQIMFVGPPVGLFDVTVYSVYAQATDQS